MLGRANTISASCFTKRAPGARLSASDAAKAEYYRTLQAKAAADRDMATLNNLGSIVAQAKQELEREVDADIKVLLRQTYISAIKQRQAALDGTRGWQYQHGAS